MKRTKKLLFIILTLVFTLIACSSETSSTKELNALNGAVNLEEWDFDEDGMVQLEGEWHFAWKEILPNGIDPTNTSYITVPGAWEDNGLRPSKGYATYTLYIKGLKENEFHALKVPFLSSAYELFINDKLFISVGTPGNSADNSSPALRVEEVIFSPDSAITELTLVVSNFDHRSSGIWGSITLGTAEQIIQETKVSITFEMILFGILLLSGLYHLTLYLLRKTELYLLLFSIFCLVIGMRILLMNESIITEIWPSIPWSLVNKIEYLTFYTALPIFTWFLYLLYQKEVSLLFCKVLSYISAVFILIVIFTPVTWFTETLYVYQAITISSMAYIIYTILLAVYRRREGARLVAIFAIFYAYTVIMDIFFVQHMLGSFELSNLGLFVFIFSQVYIIAQKLFQAFDQAEKYSHKLKELNATLEDKILERTKSLQASKLKLQEANDKLKKLSLFDQLTQIPNRRFLEEKYNKAWDKARVDNKTIAFIYFDIDYFKKYNDMYGHQEGDHTLYKVANKINDCITKQGGIAARMGGEEFVAVLANVTEEMLRAYLEDCRRQVEELQIPHAQSPSSDYLTISIGASIVSPKSYNISKQQLITIADEALYNAKEEGRNSISITVLK